jgi:hypothetical protein
MVRTRPITPSSRDFNCWDLANNLFVPSRLVSTSRSRLLLCATRFGLIKAEGLKPLCVIGNAGTVNTGAVDDLAALADLCAEHDLWFHIDGAIGAPLAISAKLRPMLRGMERVDSLAFDLHKWMQMPYDVGCVLVRDEAQHREAFSEGVGYLLRMPRGLCSGETMVLRLRSGTVARFPRTESLDVPQTARPAKVWGIVRTKY